MSELRVVFMGTPEFSVGILAAILSEKINVVGVVTVADKPAGRGQKIHESAVKHYAVEHNIPVLQPLRLKDESFLAELKQLNADVFVVVAFRMLPEEVWKMPKKGTFNLHASLLPDYRGAAPINWAIINGDTKTGLTTFFIDEKIDTGNVIEQVELSISENETAGNLHDRMMIEGGELVVKTLHSIRDNTISPIPQSEFTTVQQRPAPKLFKENTKIDWSKSVQEIHQLVCGLSPYPVAWTQWQHAKGETKSIKIFRASIENGSSTVNFSFTSDKKTIRIACNGGFLVIHEFQLEGKKRMTAQEWLAGNAISDWKIVL